MDSFGIERKGEFMNVLVNGTTLNVTNAYAERENGMIICTVIVPQSEMDYSEVKALFKGNTEDIIYTNDAEEQKIFSGFSFASILDDDANGQYIIKLVADEYAFQLGRNRELEADKASLESVVMSKDNEISNLNGTISERDKAISEKEVVITEQNETITALEAAITEKDSEIAELLTIAEEYADMLYNESLKELENETAVNESEAY